MREARKTLWLKPGEICIVHGGAVARNLMFEKKKDHQLFLKLWDRYLSGMTEVINYHLSPDTWTILFKAKTKEEIKQAYQKLRQKSNKAKRKSTLKEPKRMLSEHIRIFLSQYVRRMNAQSGRKGGLVLERFRKYIVQKHKDYKRLFDLLTNQVRFKTQTLQKYRANENDYDIVKELPNGSIWQVGRKYYEEGIDVEKVLCSMCLMAPGRRLFK